jgi:DMSO reductase anchor subunit
MATVFTTSMIYAQLKTVPQWQSALTPVVYSASHWARAGCLHRPLAAINPRNPGASCWSALAGARSGCGGLGPARTRLADTGSTPETATGLGFIGKVRLLEKPTQRRQLPDPRNGPPDRAQARKPHLRRVALVLGGSYRWLILALVALSGAPALLNMLAALSMLIGLLAERWLFFAEAEHAVSLYYGHR